MRHTKSRNYTRKRPYRAAECGKRRFLDEIGARYALMENDAKNDTTYVPDGDRVYFHQDCSAWHIRRADKPDRVWPV